MSNPADTAGFAVDKTGLEELLGFRVVNSTLLQWERRGVFPARFRLPSSPRALWLRSEVIAYLKGAAADRSKRRFAGAIAASGGAP